MKKSLIILITLVSLAILASSCQKEPVIPSLDASLTGEWHLTRTEVEDKVLNTGMDIYLSLSQDCTFEIYQKYSGQLRYTRFTGTCTYAGGILTGTYSNGTSWGAAYSVSVEDDMLILTTTDLVETQTYRKESLPQQEKDKADMKTKSSGCDILPFL